MQLIKLSEQKTIQLILIFFSSLCPLGKVPEFILVLKPTVAD
jgi:hypothetical protein